MANNIGLEFAGITDTGLIRSQNEDAIVISPSHRFAVLADGMGGYNAGEIASGIATAVSSEVLEQGLGDAQTGAVDSLFHGRPLHHLVNDAVQKANVAILEAARAEPHYQGMGTTIVVAVFRGDKVTIAHVGDSRAYRFRQGELSRITRDHSLLQEQIDAGLIDPAMARYSHAKNLVTRAVGVAAEMELEVHDHSVQAGDVYLLCSDGLTDMLPDEEIRGILEKEQGQLTSACSALVRRANDNGGFDNISVILARVQLTAAQSTGFLSRIFNWAS